MLNAPRGTWLALLLLISAAATAKEGMFTPDQLPEIAADLQATGLELDPESLTDLTSFPMGAVVSLGGCTASFVSDKGLVVTNHHCARGSVQYNSTTENNYLENGFLAETLADELPATPGSRVYVTVAVADVTDRITGDLAEDLTGKARFDEIDRRTKALLAECEADPGHRCQVPAFFGSLQYKLIKRREIKDVRLVYAPADAIGKYGGDIDNWQWPRHTGDFAFYRAYVAPDGSSAEFSEDNVPFVPAHTLKVSAKGVAEGDFVMVAGYPGSTSRYARLAEVESTFRWRYPTWISLLESGLETIAQAAPEGSDAAVKYASTVAGYNNALKNLTGQIAGAKRADLVGRRAAREAALNQWLKASEVRADDLAAIEAVDELAIESAAASREGMAYSRAKASALVGTAQSLYRLAKEREKDDAEREKGYQDRDLPFFRQRMERMERRFDPVVDKALWLNGLAYYYGSDEMGRFETFHTAMKLPADFDSDAIGGMLDDYYAGTTLMDLDQRVALMEASAADLEAMDDPFMQLAVTLHDHDMKREADEKTRKGQSTALRPAYMRAIIDWQRSEGKVAYPDANSTLRITYGTVQGGSPRDGMRHEAFTTLEGIVEKDTGEAPFNAPTAQLDAIKARDHGDYAMEELGSVPVNFMADMDVTGGNSGSATLNARAELVGLLFDMTLEAVNSDWDFNPKLSRTIQVDTRYMLWVMEQVDGAGHLIDEMQIVR